MSAICWTTSRSWSPGGDRDTARAAPQQHSDRISKEQAMAGAPGQQPSIQPSPGSATLAEVMQPPLTTVEQDDHAAQVAE